MVVERGEEEEQEEEDGVGGGREGQHISLFLVCLRWRL